MTDYNGWTNRNTWLINLHFGDVIREELQEDASTTAENIQDFIIDILGNFALNSDSIIRDFIDYDGINWHELWETICLDVFVGGEA
tara:strand:+ start:482 stop:739 length:258 start_codon:yes stop_codon:yes gene_type:complete